MALEFFHHPVSPNCMAVAIVAAELGVPLDRRFVDVGAGEQWQAEFLSLNPNGFVPVIRHDDFVLWETIPVMQYVAAQAGDTPLWPADLRQRADISRWQHWSAAHWIPALQPFVFENVFKRLKGLGEPDQERLQAAYKNIERFGAVLDDHLADRDWAVGDTMTLADLSLATYLTYADAARMPLAGFENIASWLGRMQHLPSWKAEQPKLAALEAA